MRNASGSCKIAAGAWRARGGSFVSTRSFRRWGTSRVRRPNSWTSICCCSSRVGKEPKSNGASCIALPVLRFGVSLRFMTISVRALLKVSSDAPDLQRSRSIGGTGTALRRCYAAGCVPWLIASALLCVIAGCGSEMVRPDLARLYRVAAVAPDTTPLIVVPGLFGSKLRDRTTGVEVWPGDWQRIAFDDYGDLELKFDPETLEVRRDNLEAFAIAEQVLGQDFYGPIIETLVRYGGYVRATPGTRVQPGERRYYIFTYDWRQDNVVHARELDQLIERIRADYGDPKLRVDIVAHSMGGLVSRYYLRYGPVDVLDGTPQLITLYGTERVRKLILLGTPNFGAISSLYAYLNGEPIGLKRMAPEVLATMPSGYQLFPHPIATWLIDIDGNPLSDSLFDPEVWQRYRWGIYDPAVEARLRVTRGATAEAYVAALRRYFALRLERARRLAWMLSTPEPSSPIRYVL